MFALGFNGFGQKESKLCAYPEFNGGIKEFNKFIETNLKMPNDLVKNKIDGKVYIQFDIDTTGSISNIKVVKDIGHNSSDEAIRVIKLTNGLWKPAIYMNKKVFQKNYSVPIEFKLK